MELPLVLQCCACRLVLIGTEYVPASPVKWARVSHGYCRPCADRQLAALDELIASERHASAAQQQAA